MKTTVLTIATLAIGCHTAKCEVTFDWATVGNPGNADDTTGLGGIDYTYRISKYEVTNSQYTEFLNAVDPYGFNSLGLYDPKMSSNASGGINAHAIPTARKVTKRGTGGAVVVTAPFSFAGCRWLSVPRNSPSFLYVIRMHVGR